MHTGLHYSLSVRLHHTPAERRRENGILTLVKGGMGYQWPEIKWLARKEMRPEMRHTFEVEFNVRVFNNICLLALLLWPLICSLSLFLPPTCFIHMPSVMVGSQQPVFTLSVRGVRTSSTRTSFKNFSVFMPVCVFNCCRQQTVIPLSLPCVCVGPFFVVWKMLDCMFMCVCV